MLYNGNKMETHANPCHIAFTLIIPAYIVLFSDGGLQAVSDGLVLVSVLAGLRQLVSEAGQL